MGLWFVLAVQEVLFAVAIWRTGALPLGVRDLHSIGSVFAFATGSLTAIALLTLAGLTWLSLVNLLPWRLFRRTFSFFLYLAFYLPVFNLGFFWFSRHLASTQILRDAPTYFSHAPLSHLLGLAGAAVAFFSLVVVSWRLRLFGEAWRDSSTGCAPLHETMQVIVVAAAGLAVSSGICAMKPELAPTVSTAGHLITGYLPNVRMAFLPVRSSQDAFLHTISATDTSGLLPVNEVESYLNSLREKTPPDRPNILVVMLESVPVDHVSAFGYHRKTTPNLDQLANQSLVFDRCWSVANESKHAQSSIHTSMLPMRGRNDDFSKVDYRRLPWWIVFKMLGYQTAYISTQNEDWLHMKSFQLDGQVPPDLYLHSLDIPEGPFYEGLLRKKDEETVNRRLFQYLDQAKVDGRPFVLMTNYQRTHYPFELPKNWTPAFTPLASIGEFRAWRPEEIPDGINSFDSALVYVDKNLGELIRHLDESELGSNTIVAVMSDHGIGFEPNVHPVSESLKDPYIHVPFLIRYSRKLAPSRFSGDVSTIDLFPTLLGLLGAPSNPAWEGRDVLALGPDGCTKRPVFAGSIIWLQRWLAIRGEGKVLIDLDEQSHQVFSRDDGFMQKALPITAWATGLLRVLSSTLRNHTRFYESPTLHAQHMIGTDTPERFENEEGVCRPGPEDLNAGLRSLLIRGEWYYEKEGMGRLRILTMHPDGRIRSLGLPDHPADSFWEVKDGELHFLDQNHEAVTRFPNLSVSGGVVTFRGLHHENKDDVRLLRQARMGGNIESPSP
jgi:glucan phosphoethanolaminetransferase (alkaline phosphatase superfamily)